MEKELMITKQYFDSHKLRQLLYLRSCHETTHAVVLWVHTSEPGISYKIDQFISSKCND